MVAKKDFFISHSGKDTPWATWIGYVLEKNGYTVELDVRDWGAGHNFPQKMHTALINCEKLLVVLSPNYFNSNFGQAEFFAAFAGDPHGIDGKIVPVIVGSVALDGLFKAIIHINIAGLTESEAEKNIIEGVIGSKLERTGRFPGARDVKGVRPETYLPSNFNLLSKT